MIGDSRQAAELIQSRRRYSLQPIIGRNPEIAIRSQRQDARARKGKWREMLAVETGQPAGPHSQPQESIAGLHNIVNDVGRHSVVITGEASAEIATEGLTRIKRNPLARETGYQQHKRDCGSAQFKDFGDCPCSSANHHRPFARRIVFDLHRY